jgi:hypothetical protein
MWNADVAAARRLTFMANQGASGSQYFTDFLRLAAARTQLTNLEPGWIQIGLVDL